MFAFYLFLVSAIALAVFYGSAGETINLLVKLQQGAGGAVADHFASALGFAASAGLVWLLHWRGYRTRLAQVGEGQRGLTQVYLFSLSLGFALWAMFQAASLIELVTALLMGQGAVTVWGLAGQAVKLVLTSLLWVEHLRLLFSQTNGAAKTAAA